MAEYYSIVFAGRLLFCTTVLALGACHQPTTESVAPVPVATIRVTPASVTLPVGNTQELTALLGDAAGNRLQVRGDVSNLVDGDAQQPLGSMGDAKGTSGRVVRWLSVDLKRATVDADGLVTAKAPGKVTITATSEGRSAATEVIVTEGSNAALAIAPSAASVTVGETLQFQATLHDAQRETQKAISWRSEHPSRARVDPTGHVTAIAPGPANIIAAWRGEQSVSVLTVTPEGKTVHGLDFPGNAEVNKTMRFEFSSPLAAYPATYIWRAYPRQQQSHYTTFFWGNRGPFYRSKTFYGFHPYPDWNTSSQHFWEIAAPPGGDYLSKEHVVYDRWYVQVAVCSVSGNTTVHKFYWDWPDTTKVIRHLGERTNDPPVPGLIVGDAPWNSGHEVWDGILRGFQFYDAALTPRQVAREIASPGSVRTPWYLNLNPTPSDVSDKSGNGHHPKWIGAERPYAWMGVEDAAALLHRHVPNVSQ